jgi:uncharacterized protein (TIGR03083 family)
VTYLDHVARDASIISGLVREADPGTPVPSCPGWTLVDLVGHLGGIHRWAGEIVRTGRPGQVPEPPPPPALVDWYDEGAGALLDVLRAADPDAPCWSIDRPDDRAGFWRRRQAHETAVHRVDAHLAVTGASRYDDDLGADGVDEVIAMFYPRQVRLGRQEALAETVAFADGSGRRWLLGPDDEPRAVVRGAAGELLLVLWRRRHLDEGTVEVTGDRAAVARVLAAKLIP